MKWTLGTVSVKKRIHTSIEIPILRLYIIIYGLEWRSLGCYFGVYFPSCAATRQINIKITPEWAHKQYVTREYTYTLFHFLHDITNQYITILWNMSEKNIVIMANTWLKNITVSSYQTLSMAKWLVCQLYSCRSFIFQTPLTVIPNSCRSFIFQIPLSGIPNSCRSFIIQIPMAGIPYSSFIFQIPLDGHSHCLEIIYIKQQ